MISRRVLLGAAALSPFFAVTAARASGAMAFTLAEFEAAQAKGSAILVDVSAPWCPTCRAQAPIIKKLSAQAKFKDLVVFHVDFDSQVDVLQKFGVQKQSTLIAFKGTKEMGRSVGDTDAGSIEGLLDLTA
jgi:thioredoxin 1